MNPRKNLKRLMEAFRRFKIESNSRTKLLIVGRPLWKRGHHSFSPDPMAWRNDIRFTGYLPLLELGKIMASAKALVFVSYYEGFGMPLLEAMKAARPVLCGNRTALPEIAENAALMVDPFSISSISEGLAQMDRDAELRKTLIEKGKRRVRVFSWEKTAEKIWEVMLQTRSGMRV